MRIGTTSFIYPEGWLDNVQRLAPVFRDIEILCFESQGPGAFPSDAEARALYREKREHDLTYSLHTPLDASLASADPARRAAGIQAVLRALDAAQAFEPEALVVHVYFGDREHDRRPPDVGAWRARAAASLEQILNHGIEARRLCVESLDYDYACIAPVIEELDLSIALDVGHLVRDGADELDAVRRYLPRTRIIQWHGTAPGDRDHRSLIHYGQGRARALLSLLLEQRYTGVLTLEVFREGDLRESHALLATWLLELGASHLLPPWPSHSPSG